MRVTRLVKIRGYRNFIDFEWPAELPEFGRFNLIYGWNASGKTALSSLFAHLQNRAPIDEGQVEFQIDKHQVLGATLATAVIPDVRVFNRDFIDSSVLERMGDLSPIYFFGEESVETQRKLEEREAELENADRSLAELRANHARATKTLDEFCVKQGQIIRASANTTGQNPYNNYNKADFARTAHAMTLAGRGECARTEAERDRLRLRKDATSRPALSPLAGSFPNLLELATDTAAVMAQRVQSHAIPELVDDPELASWVEEGLGLHTGDRTTEECRFCKSHLSGERISELQAHFDDAFRRFQASLGSRIQRLDDLAANLLPSPGPDTMRLYEDLQDEYDRARSDLTHHADESRAGLMGLRTALLAKRASPFEPLDLGAYVDTGSNPSAARGEEALRAVNGVVAQHNDRTRDFDSQIKRAQEELERALVADAFDEFTAKERDVEKLAADVQVAAEEVSALRSEIEDLERVVRSHLRPAEELNEDLAAYLGRNDLSVEVREAGYAMVRAGAAATNLSEGEKMAIAFLYFLKSLQDQSFGINKGVVVIDDPVSSLDANSLFSAFGYMKARTEGAGQLFVLTHNFTFFGQVKNWFFNLPKEHRPARFYMIEANDRDGVRCGSIQQLDPLLRDYQSEYHFLFKRVHEEAHKTEPGVGLESCYGAPNMARRLLESFLSFRYPGDSGHIQKQLDRVDFPPARKARVLRLLHLGSHSSHVAEPEHDLSMLSETRQVLRDVLDLMKAVDGSHFEEMERLVTSAGAAEVGDIRSAREVSPSADSHE